MKLLEFMYETPVLTVIILLILSETVLRVANAIISTSCSV